MILEPTPDVPVVDDDGLSALVRQRRAQALDAVQPLLAAEGVDVTMDQLADAAGIGRRTLFRYFPSREELLAAAIRRSYDQLMVEAFELGGLELEPEEMIRVVLERTHLVAERMGRAHWQVAADPESHGELGEAVAARQQARLSYVERFTLDLWARSGRMAAPPPRWLVDSFALVESLFAYQGLQRDLGRSTDEIITTTSRLMVAALREALRSEAEVNR
jgi:AcrR family transcriptional regulator